MDAVTIANFALARIRSANFIEDLGESSTEAQICKIHYELARDLLLGAAAWPFAVRRAVLNQTGTPPPEWAYSYAIPRDCLRLLRIADNRRRTPADERIAYAIENNGADDRVLLTDQQEATLIYVARIENVNLFAADFVEALSWRLAAFIASPLSASEELQKTALETAFALQNVAAANHYNQTQDDPPPDPELYNLRTC